MQVSLRHGDPFVRVDLAVDWRERRAHLRCEHWLAVAGATFESSGSRFIHVKGSDGSGFVLFALDAVEHTARALKNGGAHVATSLMEEPASGAFSFAYAPAERARTSAIEHAWASFAQPARVPLFTSDDETALVSRVKAADDGDGVVVTVREADGESRLVHLRCGGR
jgi:hypothetical protein